jgi:DNA repair exonuclease SbcCD ATPase subunit
MPRKKRPPPPPLPERPQEGVRREMVLAALEQLPELFTTTRGRDRLIPPDLGWTSWRLREDISVTDILDQIAERAPSRQWSNTFRRLSALVGALESDSDALESAVNAMTAAQERVQDLEYQLREKQNKIAHQEDQLADFRRQYAQLLKRADSLAAQINEMDKRVENEREEADRDLTDTLMAVGNVEHDQQYRAILLCEEVHHERRHPGSLTTCSASWCRSAANLLTEVIEETASVSVPLAKLSTLMGKRFDHENNRENTFVRHHALALYRKEQNEDAKAKRLPGTPDTRPAPADPVRPGDGRRGRRGGRSPR